MFDSTKILAAIPINQMNGSEKFLAVAFAMVGGKSGELVQLREIKDGWPQHILNGGYSPMFYPMAKKKRWVLPDRSVASGSFVVTQAGVDHLNLLRLLNSKLVKGLVIFGKKTPHTFDKTLRSLFKDAKDVVIADTYVDDSIFDTVLDEIPDTAEVRLLWGKVSPSSRRIAFEARTKRFSTQYPRYAMKNYLGFHDRFLIVDSVGYILGPSLKDAASVKPATLVGLDPKDSLRLKSFFEELWAEAS
jgi:hypothetical protein